MEILFFTFGPFVVFCLSFLPFFVGFVVFFRVVREMWKRSVPFSSSFSSSSSQSHLFDFVRLVFRGKVLSEN